MKRIIYAFVVLVIYSCNNGTTQGNAVSTDNAIVMPSAESDAEKDTVGVAGNTPIINMTEDTYEFGVVTEGEKVEHTYLFTNSGKTPLIISNVSASCGCTTPEYPKSPIKPGDSGEIKVVFDSQNQVGMQHKIITVLSNAEPSRTILHLKGEVK